MGGGTWDAGLRVVSERLALVPDVANQIKVQVCAGCPGAKSRSGHSRLSSTSCSSQEGLAPGKLAGVAVGSPGVPAVPAHFRDTPLASRALSLGIQQPCCEEAQLRREADGRLWLPVAPKPRPGLHPVRSVGKCRRVRGSSMSHGGATTGLTPRDTRLSGPFQIVRVK